LGNRGRNLQALVKDDLLALKADIFGPLDEAVQVTGRLNVGANSEVAGLLLEERVGGLLGGSLLAERCSRWLLAGLLCGRLKCTHSRHPKV
jgi:hypothetical protein